MNAHNEQQGCWRHPVLMERTMTTEQIHTCGYSCERPECIRQQRDELVARLDCISKHIGFTAADMADQGAAQFRAGYAAAKAEQSAAAQGIDLRSTMLRLAEKWEEQAAEHGVRQFTGNDHLLFANELRVQIDASSKGGSEARDGERYRWLRNHLVNWSPDDGTASLSWVAKDVLDATIDAAMQASDA